MDEASKLPAAVCVRLLQSPTTRPKKTLIVP